MYLYSYIVLSLAMDILEPHEIQEISVPEEDDMIRIPASGHCYQGVPLTGYKYLRLRLGKFEGCMYTIALHMSADTLLKLVIDHSDIPTVSDNVEKCRGKCLVSIFGCKCIRI